MPEQREKKAKKKSKGGEDADDDVDAPLTAVERLQSLNLLSRVASESGNHLGISDRTLAEFVIDMAERRIRSYSKSQIAREGGSMYDISLIAYDDDGGGGGAIRGGRVTAAPPRDAWAWYRRRSSATRTSCRPSGPSW